MIFIWNQSWVIIGIIIIIVAVRPQGDDADFH